MRDVSTVDSRFASFSVFLNYWHARGVGRMQSRNRVLLQKLCMISYGSKMHGVYTIFTSN